jgi:hypothetical protein
MAALIKCFNGYGFEMQRGRHGTSDYADALLQEIPKFENWFTALYAFMALIAGVALFLIARLVRRAI